MMSARSNCSFFLANIKKNPNTAFDIDHYLECFFGPATTSSAIPSTLIYVLLFLTGMTGNIATAVTIIKNARIHTSTNYYLLSLAASDAFILLLGIPDEIRGFWSQYPFPFNIWFCRFRSMASEAFLYISILTILAFTIERHLAIVYPLLSRMFMISRKSRIWKIILFLWIFSILNALPYGIFSEINYLPYPGDQKRLIKESAWCGVAWEHVVIRRFLVYSFVAFFLLPFVILTALYAQIGITLAQQAVLKAQMTRTPPFHSPDERSSLPAGDPRLLAQNNDVDSRRNCRHLRARISVIKMLVGIVAAFFVCFSVFHAQRLMTMYVDWKTASDFVKNLYTDLHKVSGTLYYLNPTLNPIMYAFHTKKFRYLLRKWLMPWKSTSSESRRPSAFLNSQTSNFSLRRRTLTTTQGASGDDLESAVE